MEVLRTWARWPVPRSSRPYHALDAFVPSHASFTLPAFPLPLPLPRRRRRRRRLSPPQPRRRTAFSTLPPSAVHDQQLARGVSWDAVDGAAVVHEAHLTCPCDTSYLSRHRPDLRFAIRRPIRASPRRVRIPPRESSSLGLLGWGRRLAATSLPSPSSAAHCPPPSSAPNRRRRRRHGEQPGQGSAPRLLA